MSVTVRIPDDLAEKIDALRGLVPRERWIRAELEKLVAVLIQGTVL
jgi:hypothetical protein